MSEWTWTAGMSENGEKERPADSVRREDKLLLHSSSADVVVVVVGMHRRS